MSGEKVTSPCNKFQANIFNKSKCQNCFKSRELHLLTDHGMEQAKPVYGGWLCLAPEGTDFNNPVQRSRKWQRRFFILYEHGSLSFALDELPSTLPQGTVNMNLCTEVIDAEPRTGQRNAVCIITPEQEIYIRGENKEIINGWNEQLTVYARANKQNQTKKRKVEPVASQEPSPAKMPATDPRFPTMESPAEPDSSLWQEEPPERGPNITPVWTVTDTDPQAPHQTPAGNMSRYLRPVSRESLASDGSWLSSTFSGSISSLDSVASGSSDPADGNRPAELEPNNIHTSASNKNQKEDRSQCSPPRSLVGLEPASSREADKEREWSPVISRKGRSEARTNKREKLQSCGDIAQLSAPPPQRRAKSLDRRTSESVMTPDLLNFKKGWMVKLDEQEQWKKYWFVLSTDSLRYYKDSMAEEASDLKGEIDLTKCYNVSEYQVQRNYGFQIHTQKGVYTLSAMTAGIRRNWIQALMKNVHPSNAPDVASLPGHHIPCKPDVTQDSSSTEVPAEIDKHSKPTGVMERRREGRYRTFDWAEFRPLTKPTLDLDAQRPQSPWSLELGDLERKKRREERRRRYESMLGFPLAWEVIGDLNEADGDSRASSPRSQQKMVEEIEQCWQQVERTMFRLERTVPVYTDTRDTAEMERLLDSYRQRVEDLKAQLAQSDHHRLELEAQLSTASCHQQHVCPMLDPPLSTKADFGQLGTNEKPLNSHTQSLKEMYRETRELLQQQNMIRQSMQEQLSLALSSSAPQPPSIWLHDTEGNLQELGGFLPDCPVTENTSLLSPTLDSQHLLLQSEEETRGANLDSSTTGHQNRLNRDVHQQVPSTETQTDNSEWSASSLIMEETVEGDNNCLNCCNSLSYVDEHMIPDQAVVKRLSQEVELLTGQNEALNQRNQEMLNQLTEADREIERLKAELMSRHSEPYHISEVEQLSQTRVEDLEKELSTRNQQLLEAQSLIASMERCLRDSEVAVRLKEASLPGLETPAETEETEEEQTDKLHYDKKAEGYLLRCFEATEAKLTELERQLRQSELTCRELQAHNAELREAERLCRQRAAEAESDIKRLNQELEKERLKEEKKSAGTDMSVSDEERIQQVVEGMAMRLEALGNVLEVIDRLDLGVIKKSIEIEDVEEKPALVSHLMWEEESWRALLNELKVTHSQENEEKHVEVLLSEVAEHMVVEKQMLLLVHGLFSETDSCTVNGTEGLEGMCESKPLKDLDIIGNIASVAVSENKENDGSCGILNLNDQHCDTDKSNKGHFAGSRQLKTSLLRRVASSASDKLQCMADRLCDFNISEHPWSDFIPSVTTEALYRCHVRKLQSAYWREHAEIKEKLLSSSLICSNCAGLMNENEELRARLANLEKQMVPSSGAEMPTLSQTERTYLQDTDNELHVADSTGVSIADEMEEENLKQDSISFEEAQKLKTLQEMVEEDSSTHTGLSGMENPVSSYGGQEKISDENTETTDVSHEVTDPSLEAEEIELLRRRVKDLEEQLSVIAEQMKEELDGKMSSVQLQHERDMEKLKATYECGFTAMDESHQKLLDELQRRHQQDVERLLLDRDRLLEEETAATAIAIEAIKNAHRLELEREVQRRCQSNSSVGSTDLEEICRQHGEELASCERELEVLSQQYSLKCLENGHLGQALDAERKALCQCQQENQDLRTRNQELSGHLAAEITRLCSLAKQDAPQLSQGMDVYEMEITLRVKESEVQCLKQEIASLKDELQSAQRDKRSATKKYKDIYTELSIVRAKTEQDIDQLRENLRLAHQALGETSP